MRERPDAVALELFEVRTQALASPSGRGTSRREGERDVQTVVGGMQFVSGIGAVGLWVVLWWNWCGEPSQALRASSPGGRAKGLVGADGRVGETRVGGEMQFRMRDRCGGAVGGFVVELVR